jgi:Ras-related protein Rab-5C
LLGQSRLVLTVKPDNASDSVAEWDQTCQKKLLFGIFHSFMKIQRKVILVGDSRVGKSSIAVRATSGEFVENVQPTISAAYLPLPLETAAGVQVALDLWDTAGQERYRSLISAFFRDASAALICFDIAKRQSFDGLAAWARQVRESALPGCILIIVGNKADLEAEREVQSSEAEDLASEIDALFREASAKTGQGIKDIFEGLAERLSNKPLAQPDTIHLDAEQPAAGGSYCCW